MPLPIPAGKKIHITHTRLDSSYEMPSLEASEDHYGINLIIHGDRQIITPDMQCLLHPGYVGTIAPFLYHKTLPASHEYYEKILIKFAPDYISALSDAFGPQIIDTAFKYPVKHFNPDITGRISNLFQQMYQEYSEGESNYSDYRLKCMLQELILLIIEHDLEDKDNQIHNTPLSKNMIDALFYMEQNYMNPIKIEEVAQIAGYSTAYFSRLFQSQLNTSFSDYLNSIRLKHVKSLLISTEKSVTDIALETGFVYPGNMTTLFKKYFNTTPLAYKKAWRKPHNIQI